jgi:hypothetical protein
MPLPKGRDEYLYGGKSATVVSRVAKINFHVKAVDYPIFTP